MLADYSFYTGPFGGSFLSEEDFNHYEPYAERYIHTITFGRLLSGYSATDAVRMAICSVTDVLAEQAEAASKISYGAKSETVGSYSVSYDDYTNVEARISKERLDAASPYLLPTGLMDRGIYRVHKC